MINPNLLNTVNQYFARHKSQSFVVNPSIPILYFGDEEADRASYLKVITVGKNPSLNEFLDKGLGKFNVLYRFPNFNGKNYTSVWNEYFQKKSLAQWFSAFEPILNGMYKETLNHLRNDYKNLDKNSEEGRQRHIRRVTEKIETLGKQISGKDKLPQE